MHDCPQMNADDVMNDEVEAAFAPVSELVVEFNAAHELDLNKCVRGNSGWELTRLHPAGGAIILLMMYERSHGLGIGSVWQVPCEELNRLYSHFRAIRQCAIEPTAVKTMLDEELNAILAVKFGYWTNLLPLHQQSKLT